MSDPNDRQPPGVFSTTKWTMVIQVIKEGNDQAARDALAQFCVQYRPAVYGFMRRRGYSHEMAEDYVQEFFESRILEKWREPESFLHKADRGFGKFRSFLSQVVIRFLQDKTKASKSKKAGGEFDHVSAEALAESGYTLSQSVDPEGGREFDLEYARTVIQLATNNLKYADHHLAFLMGKKRQAEIADELGMTEGAFKVSHHRFRQRFGEAIREVVKNAVGDDESEVTEEIRYLMSLFERLL